MLWLLHHLLLNHLLLDMRRSTDYILIHPPWLMLIKYLCWLLEVPRLLWVVREFCPPSPIEIVT
jgi:hypothetical protein